MVPGNKTHKSVGFPQRLALQDFLPFKIVNTGSPSIPASVFLPVTDLSSFLCFSVFNCLSSFQGKSLPCDLSSLIF